MKLKKSRIIYIFYLLLLVSFVLSGCHVANLAGTTTEDTPNQSVDRSDVAMLPLTLPIPRAEEANYLAKLHSKSGGKGIFIFSPITTPEKMAFATGCARWLFLTMGGAHDLPQTPMWYQGDKVQIQLERKDLCLTPEEGRKAAAMLGATHYATGTLEENRMVFQVYDREGKAVGEPVTLLGNAAQIVAGLPEAARALRGRLGLGEKTFSPPTETPEELALAGRIPVLPDLNLSETEAMGLHKMAMHSALGNLLYLGTTLRAERDPEPYEDRVKRLLTQAKENHLVLAELAYHWHSPEVTSAIKTATMQGADTLSLSFCLLQLPHNPKEHLSLAEKLVQYAPNNSEAWWQLSHALSQTGQAIRKGRTADMLTAKDSEQLTPIYNQWYATACQAVLLNPKSGAGYGELAAAATFVGDRYLARAAMEQGIERAMRRRGVPEVFSSAMEFNDPKWGGSIDKKKQIAERAATLKVSDLLRSVGVMEVLAEYDYIPQAHKLGDTILEVADHRLQLDPSDIVAHDARKAALARTGRKPEALKEAQRCLELRPNDAFEKYQLVESYRNLHQYDQATLVLQKLITEFPKEGRYRNLIVDLLIQQKRFSEALPQARLAVELDPQNVKQLNQLGTLLSASGQLDKALILYQKASAISPSGALSMSNVGETLCRMGRIQEGRPLVEEAMRRTHDKELIANGEAVLKEFPAPK